MRLAKLTESVLFSMLKNELIPDLEKTEGVSRWDGYSAKHSMAIEIKCRRAVYDDMLIEKDKYDFLRAFRNCRYIVSDPVGIYSFDLKIIEPAGWYPHYMPFTTEFLDTEKVVKMVGYLPKKYAINITNKLTNETNYSKL